MPRWPDRELVATLPNGTLSMPVDPTAGRTQEQVLASAAEMMTRALAARLGEAVWAIRSR